MRWKGLGFQHGDGGFQQALGEQKVPRSGSGRVCSEMTEVTSSVLTPFCVCLDQAQPSISLPTSVSLGNTDFHGLDHGPVVLTKTKVN